MIKVLAFWRNRGGSYLKMQKLQCQLTLILEGFRIPQWRHSSPPNTAEADSGLGSFTIVLKYFAQFMTGVQPKLSQGGSGGSEVQIMIGAARGPLPNWGTGD